MIVKNVMAQEKILSVLCAMKIKETGCQSWNKQVTVPTARPVTLCGILTALDHGSVMHAGMTGRSRP